MACYINLGLLLFFFLNSNLNEKGRAITCFQDSVLSDWSSLKKCTESAAGSSGFGRSRPTLSLCQSLQVLTWFLLKMDTCRFGACWLPCRLTNPHTRQDQPAWSPLQLMPRLGVIWISHPLHTRLKTFLFKYPELGYNLCLLYPNALFELLMLQH